MEGPPAPMKKVSPAQVRVKANFANTSFCGRTVNTAMSSHSFTALCSKEGPPRGSCHGQGGDRGAAAEASAGMMGSSWKVRFGAVESLLRPQWCHTVLCAGRGLPGPAGELCPFASTPQLLGCDLGSAALTLLHPCHGTCDWRGLIPRKGGQCKSASP